MLVVIAGPLHYKIWLYCVKYSNEILLRDEPNVLSFQILVFIS